MGTVAAPPFSVTCIINYRHFQNPGYIPDQVDNFCLCKHSLIHNFEQTIGLLTNKATNSIINGINNKRPTRLTDNNKQTLHNPPNKTYTRKSLSQFTINPCKLDDLNFHKIDTVTVFLGLLLTPIIKGKIMQTLHLNLILFYSI